VDWPIAPAVANDEVSRAFDGEATTKLPIEARHDDAPRSQTPSFGVAFAEDRSALPAFTPPESLRVAAASVARSPRAEAPATEARRAEDASSPELALVSDLAALDALGARKTKLLGFVIGVTVALAALAMLVLAR